MTIEIIAGSPRSNSLSLRVAKHLHQVLSVKTEHAVGLINLHETVFPFVQDVWKNADQALPELKPVAERMFKADGFIVVSPEYNGAYSPALKNLFDHFPKQARKPFGIAVSSPGAMGGIRASQQLLQMVPSLFGIASPSLLIVPQVDKKFSETGELVDGNFQLQVDTFVAEFLWLSAQLKK